MPREAQELVRQGGFKDAEKFFILSLREPLQKSVILSH